jgi:CRISPR-associated exonuclease Cas4
MSENPIIISNLNDFIFCPVSIYFHTLEEDEDKVLNQDSFQLNGSAAHEKSDSAAYSTKKSMLQGAAVY